MLLDHPVQSLRLSSRNLRITRQVAAAWRGLSTVDLLLGACGALALLVEGLLRESSGTSRAAYLLVLLAGGSLAFRTRAPLAALVLAEITAVACSEVLHASWSATAIVAVQLYTVALLGGRLRSVITGALTAIGVTVAILIIAGSDLEGVATRLPLVFLSLAIGDTVRSRAQLRAAAAERAAREMREREDEVRRLAAAERLQIARELHDTLGHLLVAINVRAGVAVEVPDSTDAATALEDIKDASAGALRELRSTLTVLREEHDSAPTAPALDLSALPALVQNARAAGLQATLEVAVDGAELPSAIRGATVRIVQEGLTNVLRHAEASSVRVDVRRAAGAVEVEIVDDGAATEEGDAGYGLRGMTERAGALGGRLEAGPCKGGGWRVFARLPLTDGAPR